MVVLESFVFATVLCGFFGIIFKQNLMMKIIAMDIMSTGVIASASAEQWHHIDSKFGNDFRVALGLLLNIDFNYWGREGNVGTAGAGGYAAFADPVNHLSYGYTPNRFGSGAGLGDQHRALVDALYTCV